MKKQRLFELEARYDKRKSFYCKAMVEETVKYITLYSYGVVVAYFNKNNNILFICDKYSQTTNRHIREFAQQLGFGRIEKIEMKKIKK